MDNKMVEAEEKGIKSIKIKTKFPFDRLWVKKYTDDFASTAVDL